VARYGDGKYEDCGDDRDGWPEDSPDHYRRARDGDGVSERLLPHHEPQVAVNKKSAAELREHFIAHHAPTRPVDRRTEISRVEQINDPYRAIPTEVLPLWLQNLDAYVEAIQREAREGLA